MSRSDLSILVVGSGSIGKRHLQNLYHLGYRQLAVCHSRQRPLNEVEAQLGVRVFRNLDEALAWSPDITLVTNPTTFHVPTALAAVKAGSHVLVEKPLSHSLDGVAELENAATQHHCLVMVAYNLRFCASLGYFRDLLIGGAIGRPLTVRAQVGSYLPSWRPQTDYRQVYSSKAELGGGAILDLSHELDYILWLLGPAASVTAMMGKLSELEMSAEDAAEILVRHTSGVFASVHLDFFDHAMTRCCRIVGTEGTLIWDYFADEVRHFDSKRGVWISHSVPTTDRNEMYLAELRHFLDCVASDTSPSISLQDGINVLRVALAAKAAASTGIQQEISHA